MGCGCSMHNKRVAAAQKATDQATSSVEAVEDVGQNTPATVINEQQAVLEPASPQNGERAFLQGMSPPSSPGGLALKDSPVAQASDNDPPVPVVSDTVAKETVITPPAVLPAGELGEGDSVVPRTDGGVVAVPSAEPSTGGRRTGGGGELTEDGEGGGSARVTGRSVELILRPGGLQEQPRRFSKQDTLPQLAPLPAVSADLSSTQRRGHTLGPGLDIAFREEPTSIVPTAAADSLAGDEGSGNGHTGVGPIPVDQRRSEGGAGSARHANKGGQGNSDEVMLTVTPVTPDDMLDEDATSDRGAPAKDRWPRNDEASGFPPTSGRGKHYDRMGDEDGTPPRHEARPALAAGALDAVPQAASSRSFGGREVLSSVDFTADGSNDLSAATGGMDSSGDDGAWGATSGAYSLLDADEENFMETLLMES